MSSYLLSVAPLAVLLVSLVMRRGAVVSAVLGSGVIFAVCYFAPQFSFNWEQLLIEDSLTVLILTLTVAVVIIPGQIMNSFLKDTGVIQAIGARVRSVRMSDTDRASVIILGLAPALESLTGFGVSLFLTVPLLLCLFPLRTALVLSLLGMNIMPWGTLSLATTIGANLAGLPAAELAKTSCLTSFLVFPVIGVLLAVVIQADKTKTGGFYYPVSMGFVLATGLCVYNHYFDFEVAGIISGLTVIVVAGITGLARSGKSGEWKAVSGLLKHNIKPLFKLLYPYIILLVLMSLSRMDVFYSRLKDVFVLQNDSVSFPLLTSPGLIILGTIFLIWSFNQGTYRHTYVLEGLGRSRTPIISIMIFLIFAQLQRSSGIIDHLATLGEKTGGWKNIFLSPLLGMISGYTTGSNVGGNTLLMSLQVVIGEHVDQGMNYAAVQNSSAGHAVFMSIPVVVLALSIARNNETRIGMDDQHWLIRRMLLFSLPVYASLVGAFFLIALIGTQ